jgi:hypothetical protein
LVVGCHTEQVLVVCNHVAVGNLEQEVVHVAEHMVAFVEGTQLVEVLPYVEVVLDGSLMCKGM